MRPNTPKRAAQNRLAAKIRKQIVAEVERCEWCGRYFSLACHEIGRGSSRLQAQDQRSAILVLCNAPHGTKPCCHEVVGNWPREKQLALLLLRRGGDYSLEKFWEVTGRRFPEQEDVDGWVDWFLRTRL